MKAKPLMPNNFLHSARFRELEQRHQVLMQELAGLGWLTDGSVIPNHPGCWRWTRKVNAKTVAVSLSAAQAELFKSAIANHRKLEAILRELRAISQEVLLNSAESVRRKPSAKTS
jgi:hypothetical protein